MSNNDSINTNTTGRSDSLVQLRPHFIGFTLNYSPKWSFKVDKILRKWGELTPPQQKDIFDKHIEDIYRHHFHVVEYTFELTKQGNVHCHAMGTVDINPDHSDFYLWTLRKTIGQHPEIQRYTKGNQKAIQVANYIHYVDREKWVEYMSKDAKHIPFRKTSMLGYVNGVLPPVADKAKASIER